MHRVRFAPSPTGYLHIGSARTFIFNWLFVRRETGQMILRIDDTDVDRNTEASLESIYDGLHWLGLAWDEHYRQSERLTLHTRLAWDLFDRGKAYRDFTPATDDDAALEPDRSKGQWLFNPGMPDVPREESDRRADGGEPFVLRFRVPRGSGGTVDFHDAVYGAQSKSCDDIEDFALLRSDGMPTYHMASCADDADLRITDIIRGQDHLSNTFKHILIFEALETRLPAFAHLPLLIAPDGSKLSKRRHGAAVSVATYRDAGFLPHAYVNSLCLLGWSPKDNREQMSRQELMDAFSLTGVNRANAVVNFTEADPIDPKALWLNSQHLRSPPVGELAPLVREVLEKSGLRVPEPESRFHEVIDIIRSRFATLNEFATLGRPYFADDFPMQPEALETLDSLHARELLRALATENGVKAGVLINASRAALTGQTVGPSAFAVSGAVGRDRAIERLNRA